MDFDEKKTPVSLTVLRPLSAVDRARFSNRIIVVVLTAIFTLLPRWLWLNAEL